MTALVDMTGQTVNGYQVIDLAGSRGGKPAWRCRCTCGQVFIASGSHLRLGRARGCASCAKASAIAGITKHGGVGTGEYITYAAMKSRCLNPNDKRYARYGGRGIQICERWLASFANFLEDMGPRPSAGHSIERFDTDKGYDPTNCIWADLITQANNRSNNTRIEINGRVQNITAWSRETGVNRTVILRRMKRGLSGEALIQKGATR